MEIGISYCVQVLISFVEALSAQYWACRGRMFGDTVWLLASIGLRWPNSGPVSLYKCLLLR
jgi:hypothetical protein